MCNEVLRNSHNGGGRGIGACGILGWGCLDFSGGVCGPHCVGESSDILPSQSRRSAYRVTETMPRARKAATAHNI